MSTILIVDDDPAIREMLRMTLNMHEFEVLEAGNTLDARQVLGKQRPDLILLDWMLPGHSGYEFARSLRADTFSSSIPVIMLTARGEEADKVAALEAGADDYISKPFSVRELLARINAVLRRTLQQDENTLLEVDGLALDPTTCRVTANQTTIDLPPLEFRLLHFFMSHQERVYSRQQLIEQVWSTYHLEERTVDVHIRRLRIALEPSGHDRMIQTVRGSGYRFSRNT